MPSGKPRRHKPNAGGRPTNKERYDQQQAQILRLRQLVSHRNHTTETWQLVDRLMTILLELDDQSTPQRSTTWDNTGHTTEQPILPGVTITDRGIVHAGTYADVLAKWLHREVQWAITSAGKRLKGEEVDPKPRPPRRPVEVGSTQ